MNPKKTLLLLLMSIFSLSLFTACGKNEPPEIETVQNENEQEQANEMFRPAEHNMQAAERYEYPFMGMAFTLPKAVREKMESEEIAMLTSEAWTQSEEISYAFVSWNTMTEEQRTAEVPVVGTGYMDWANSLLCVGTLGIYEKSLDDDLDKITGCTEHQHLGDTEDGEYSYYLSVNSNASQAIADDLKHISTTFIEKAPFQQTTAFDMPFEEFTGTNIGEFSTEDIHGNGYTRETLSENKLTMVNVFTTWCTPCVEEIPHLEELAKTMKDKGFGIIGLVMDATESEGLEKAKLLAERTGATYPFLIPDDGNMNGKLNSISAYPTTFFVDKNGEIVGDEYLGAHDLAGWTEIVEATLADLESRENE